MRRMAIVSVALLILSTAIAGCNSAEPTPDEVPSSTSSSTSTSATETTTTTVVTTTTSATTTTAPTTTTTKATTTTKKATTTTKVTERTNSQDDLEALIKELEANRAEQEKAKQEKLDAAILLYASKLTGTQADIGKVVGWSSAIDAEITVVSVMEGYNVKGCKYTVTEFSDGASFEKGLDNYEHIYLEDGYIVYEYIEIAFSDGTSLRRSECIYCHEMPCPYGGGEKCLRYSELTDHLVYCRNCGHRITHRVGTYDLVGGHHHRFTRDTDCPDCGEFVKRMECHLCGGPQDDCFACNN